MRGADDRATGTVLRLLDLSGPLEQAKAWAVEQKVHEKYDVAPEDLKVRYGWEPYGYAQAANGKEYVICHEGVGWEVSAEKPLLLEAFCSSPRRFGMFSDFETRLTLEEVHALATGGEVDLSEHVRRFGARLETNFWVWHRTLRGA